MINYFNMENLVLTERMVSPIKQSLIDGLTIASGAKSNATYYHSKDEQLNAIKTQIKKLYGVSKELPLIIATQKGATGRFVSEVLLNEFRNTLRGGACNIVNPIDWYDNGLSDKAILMALNNLGDNGLPYVLRLFVDMKNARINNERMRKIGLGYIWGQSNLEFYSMKYRNKIADIFRHIYGERRLSILISIARKNINTNVFVGTDKEMNIANKSIFKYYNGDTLSALKMLLFITKNDVGVDFSEFELLSEYITAKSDITSVTRVPEEILLGLISNVTHPQYHNMWATEEQRKETKALIRKNVKVTSVNQQVRQTKSTAKLGVEKTVDMNKATDFLALYKTGYENGFTPEIRRAINSLAKKKKINNFYYKNIGVIVDDSISMTGHKVESKNTPKAIADFTEKVLIESSERGIGVATKGEVTDLASAFIKLLRSEHEVGKYDAIFIITDGYENSYDGLTNEVISIWKAESGRNIPIFQISPITSAEMGANVRNIGNNAVVMSINDPVAIQPQINARLLEIDTKRWIENQVKVLDETNISRSRKINDNI
jgi:hypothetical protein